jgi:hypothetical protein
MSEPIGSKSEAAGSGRNHRKPPEVNRKQSEVQNQRNTLKISTTMAGRKQNRKTGTFSLRQLENQLQTQ